jgi:hypothetical protein
VIKDKRCVVLHEKVVKLHNLASSVDSVGVKSIRISVENRSRAGEASGSAVTVAVVLSTRAVNARGVGLLVEDSGGLVLSMALGRESRKIAEEERAVSDVVVGGESVGEYTRRATTVDIGACLREKISHGLLRRFSYELGGYYTYSKCGSCRWW